MKIPETITYNGVTYVITSVAWGGFSGYPEIKRVELNRYFKSLSVGAFSGCENMESISIPDGVEYLGRHAFAGCSSLKDIIIPTSVKSLKWGTFNGCSSLQNICFGHDITVIPHEMFQDNISLTKFSVPAWVETLGINAFKGCTNLTIGLHNQILYIYDGCFDENDAIFEIILPLKLKTLSNSFKNCKNLWHLTLTSPNPILVENVCEGSPLKMVSLNNSEVLQKNCDKAFPMYEDERGLVFEVKAAKAQEYLDYYTDYMKDYVSVEINSAEKGMVFFVNPCEEESQFDSNYFARLTKETSLLVNKYQSVVVGWKVDENNISETPYLNGVELTDIVYQNGMALVKLEGLTKNSVLEVKAINAGVDMVTESAEYEVFSLDGVRIYKGADTAVKETLPKGVYIVKQNGNTTKIVK